MATTPIDDPSGEQPGQQPEAEPAPPSSALALFVTSHLFLSTFIVLFACLTAWGLRLAGAGTIWALGLAVGAACLVGAAAVRRSAPVGLAIGVVVHIALLVGGFWVPLLFALGVVLSVIFLACILVGRRIDAERQDHYERAHHQWREAVSSSGDHHAANSHPDQT